MAIHFLTALPVYNEAKHVGPVLDEVLRYSPRVLVVDDGSTDGTSDILARRGDIEVIHHERNRGYGAGLASAFAYSLAQGYEALVTIDCDGQHEPKRIPEFVAATARAPVVSGSRYLKTFDGDSLPPEARRRINVEITAELNRRFGFQLTDAFCGFKAYRADALRKLHIRETGYAMPLEAWAQIAAAGLEVVELPVPLIYLDEARSFGGSLDNAAERLAYYYRVLDQSQAAVSRGTSGCSWPDSGVAPTPCRG
jgi:dolichol-phosphate mannosyltransferase